MTFPQRVRVAGDLFHGRLPADAVYVGRSAPGLPRSRWANRHPAGKPCRACGLTHDRWAAVAAYAADLSRDPALTADARSALQGRDLACWCHPDDRPCHADLLLLVATGLDALTALVVLVTAHHAAELLAQEQS
ncbi:DUF4326 domain-containing protein [Cryptosporangium sp. NPDC051539]|uniref:DUF4326 domain-containing protein n=1 Tax=Cryptosporangium sp. NPDC051539 TaxID=3363962 RepID=UPI00378D4356